MTIDSQKIILLQKFINYNKYTFWSHQFIFSMPLLEDHKLFTNQDNLMHLINITSLCNTLRFFIHNSQYRLNPTAQCNLQIILYQLLKNIYI